MPKGIYITLKDLMILEGVKNESTASRTLQIIRDSIGKKNAGKITIREYAAYRGVAYEEVITELTVTKNVNGFIKSSR